MDDDQGVTTPPWHEPARGATGRGTAVLVAVALPILLLVSWWIQLAALLQRDFGPQDERLGQEGVLVAWVIGALLAVGVPVVAIVWTARARRRDPRRSLAAVISAIVVLVIAVPINVLGVGGQTIRVVSDARLRAQPATAAERTFSAAGTDPEQAMEQLGRQSVEALGGDLRAAYRDDGARPGGAFSEECLLSNLHEGVQWRFQFHATEWTDRDGNDLVPEGAETVPGGATDTQAVRDAWAAEGIGARRDDVNPDSDQWVPVADWLEGYSYVRPGPGVDLTTICLEQ